MNRLARYNPADVLNDINKLFTQTFYPLSSKSDSSQVETGQWVPAVDIKEEKKQFTILIDLPGIDKKNISIGMEDNILTVQGERQSEAEEKTDNYYRVERVSGKFYRRFTLPETADENQISASITKGVLNITIHKKEATKPKSIEIKGDD